MVGRLVCLSVGLSEVFTVFYRAKLRAAESLGVGIEILAKLCLTWLNWAKLG